MATPLPQAEPSAVDAPAVLAFATQKGGMGKTTLSVLVASWLHYKRRCSVAILDVDGSQLSVYNQRLREIEQLDEDTQARHEALGVDAYPIMAGNPDDVPRLLTELPAGVDLVLIDLPGNIEAEGYDTAIKHVDLLVVPMETSEYSVTTGFNYLQAIREINLLPTEKCRVVWNKYKEARDGIIADQLEERFAEYGFQCLKARIPARDSYQDSANRSTLFPMPTPYLRNSGLKDLFTEIQTLLPLKQTL